MLRSKRFKKSASFMLLIALLVTSLFQWNYAYADDGGNSDEDYAKYVRDYYGEVDTSSLSEEEKEDYYKILEEYLKGNGMKDSVVEKRKEVANELGLSEYLNEKSYLSQEYISENSIGMKNEISDPKLNMLIEMGTLEGIEKMLNNTEKVSDEVNENLSVDPRWATGDWADATQQPKLAGNGYFTISGGSSYGFCAQNSKPFWGNGQTKSGKITEWGDEVVRKILYYSPGGPGYTSFTNNLGSDIDYATFAIGKRNGDCANNTKANKYIDWVSNFADPASKGFKAFKIDIDDSYQDVAFLGLVPQNGTLQLFKSSSNTSISSGNNCYSLAGAQYGVYSSSSLSGASRVGTLTTDANGTSNKLSVKAGTYYVREISAPAGFYLDGKTYTATVTANNQTPLKVSDKPKMDPIRVLLKKVDKSTGNPVPVGQGSLAGAEFTFKFYKGNYADGVDPGLSNVKPDKTWVFRTDKDGFIYFNNNYKVSGDSFYLDNGYPSLPYGNLVITETKAPEGYHINGNKFVKKIVPGNTDGVVTTVTPIVEEDSVSVKIIKVQDGTEIRIPNTVFEHTMPDGTKETVTTNDKGEVEIVGLAVGKHSIVEKSTQDGYTVNENVFEFEVDAKHNVVAITKPSDDNNFGFVTSNGDGTLTVGNKTNPYSVNIKKANEKGKLLDGAEFTVFSDKELTSAIETKATKDGYVKFDNLEIGTKYYFQETKAPEGYRLPDDNPVYEVYAESEPVNGKFDFYVNGQKYTVNDTKGDIFLSGDIADRVINFGVTNNTMMKLPETGSNLMIPIIVVGVGLMVVSLVIFGKKKSSKESK